MAKKRSAGEGNVRKRENGTWRGEIMDGYTQEGKRNIVRFSGGTKGEVLDKIREYRNGQDAGLSIDKDMTLGDWGDTWYCDYKSQVQASTHAGYRYTLKIIRDCLGSRKIHEVLPLQINQMMDRLVSQGYSMSTITKCRAMLIQLFDAAESNGLIASNPARKAKVIRDRDGSLVQPSQEKDAFSEEEIAILCKELPCDLLGNSIRFMLSTGVRVQELIALAPEDIAIDGSMVSINKAIKMVDGTPVLGKTKSKKSVRTIPVPEDARACAIYLRTHGGESLIWSLPGNNPYYSVGAFRRRYYTALKKIDGVRRLSPHCCRHTYVTRLQAKGVSLELIARLVGHSNISTTHGYTHTSDKTLAVAVSVLSSHAQSSMAE